MKVFGVDCAKNRVHIVGDGTAFEYVVKPGTPRDEALFHMRERLIKWLALEQDATRHGTRLYVEAPVVAGARNIQATIGIAETVGMVLSLGFPATLVAISSWKKKVIGSGAATKEDVERWYKSTGGSLRGQDFYDAAAIYEYGRQDVAIAERLRGGLLTTAGPTEVPEHGQALAKVARPS